MNIQVRLDKIIYGGRVLGRYNGKVVFVDAVLNGSTMTYIGSYAIVGF